jgi:hypothetical protein
VTRRTIIKLTPIIRILIQIIKPTIVLRVIRRRERNKRKSIIRSRPPMLNRRPLKIKIKAQSQKMRSQRTTMTIRSLVCPQLTTLMSLIPPLVRLIGG